jgi:hypothetical protein
VLHDYVPFYFAPRSPMLGAIHIGNVTGYTSGQQSIVHLVTTAEAIAEADLGFVFSDGHAVMGYTSFYDDLNEIDAAIDWDIMGTRYWRDTEEDGDRCRGEPNFATIWANDDSPPAPPGVLRVKCR